MKLPINTWSKPYLTAARFMSTLPPKSPSAPHPSLQRARPTTCHHTTNTLVTVKATAAHAPLQATRSAHHHGSTLCTPPQQHALHTATAARSVRLLRGERLELLQQLLAVAGAVVLDDLLGVHAVDDLHRLLELGARRLGHLLHRRQAAAVHKRGAPAGVVGQHLAHLLQHHLHHALGQRPLHQRVQRGQVRELGDDGLERAPALGLEVLAGRRVRLQRHQRRQHARVRHRLGVVGRVPPDLAQRPRDGRLHVVLRLLAQRAHQRRQRLLRNHAQRQRLAEGRDVAQRHDARQPIVARALAHVVH
mmetsp:Transcript_2173/g.5521  ORF Transcript_2173/g.5521 Transcript_2173/m.5521 type:complete len:305 (+) Transcript_2173:176-1090(+)